MDKIVFYFRKNVLAKGDFSLYYRIASYIAENYDCKVYCVNNSNPELQMKYLDSKIIFCDIEVGNRLQFEDATFITAFNQVFFLLEEIRDIKNTKLILLFLHPQIVDWLLNQVNRKSFDLREVLSILKKNSAYGFMDKSNKLALNKFSDIKFEERYFPVALDESNIIGYEPLKRIDDNALNIAWFGRLDRDKIFSVTNFLDNLLELDSPCRVNIHIIGDGNAKELINVAKYTPQMQFYFTSYLYSDERDSYVKENADLVVAMGISALDVALLGVPTIIPIVSPVNFREDKFVYLFDIVGYSLGWNNSDLKKLGCKAYTFQKIVSDIYYEDKKTELGQKCYNFAVDTFSISSFADKVYSLLCGSTLRVEQFIKCKSISRHLNYFDLYRRIRRRRNYSDFTVFMTKIAAIRKQKVFQQIGTIATQVNRIIKEGAKDE